MTQPYVRDMSPTERLWATADALRPPFCITMMLEGEGHLDETAWRAAVAKVSAARPESRVVWRGVLCRSRWVAAVDPSVRVHHTEWDGRSEAGAEFLRTPLSLTEGPVVDVLLLPGSPARVVVRAQHAGVDGRGLLAWLLDVLGALLGLEPVPSSELRTDLELARSSSVAAVAPPEERYVAATGRHDGTDGIAWRRRTWHGQWPGFLQRVADGITRYARRGDPAAPVCLHVPVDLRRHLDGEVPFGNLTGIIFLDPDQGPLRRSIHDALEAGAELGWVAGLAAVKHLPLWLMRVGGERAARRSNEGGRYGATAVLSNLGHVAPEALVVPGVAFRSIMLLPPPGPATAAFFGFVRCGGITEATVMMPAGLASEGRIDALLDAVEASLAR